MSRTSAVSPTAHWPTGEAAAAGRNTVTARAPAARASASRPLAWETGDGTRKEFPLVKVTRERRGTVRDPDMCYPERGEGNHADMVLHCVQGDKRPPAACRARCRSNQSRA